MKRALPRAAVHDGTTGHSRVPDALELDSDRLHSPTLPGLH